MKVSKTGAFISNGALLNAAEEAAFDLLLTTDRRIRHQQNLTVRRIALVVLTGRIHRSALVRAPNLDSHHDYALRCCDLGSRPPSLPEVTPRKCAAGACLQVGLEPLRLGGISELDGDDHLPGSAGAVCVD